ncbi:MAG: hypothetical protein LHV69_05580 [Elusimicrobia bacterium]|nr:hypothetical protein [Candidatus Obscuribacterium magneticum]
MPEMMHTCGWTIGAADKYCRGCGERVFKASREYGEMVAEMEALKNMAMEKPHPAFAAIAMMIFNILSWAAGESQTRPLDLLKQMEKMADRLPGGWGFPPPGSTP